MRLEDQGMRTTIIPTRIEPAHLLAPEKPSEAGLKSMQRGAKHLLSFPTRRCGRVRWSSTNSPGRSRSKDATNGAPGIATRTEQSDAFKSGRSSSTTRTPRLRRWLHRSGGPKPPNHPEPPQRRVLVGRERGGTRWKQAEHKSRKQKARCLTCCTCMKRRHDQTCSLDTDGTVHEPVAARSSRTAETAFFRGSVPVTISAGGGLQQWSSKPPSEGFWSSGSQLGTDSGPIWARLMKMLCRSHHERKPCLANTEGPGAADSPKGQGQPIAQSLWQSLATKALVFV